MQKTDFDIEILVHDDASTDNTQSILREYESKYPDKIFPLYETENKYSNSTTEYVNDDHSIGKTNIKQEQNIKETNNIDITHENYNYGDQSVGKNESTDIRNEENTSYGSGNDQEPDSDAYDYGNTDRYAAGGAGEGSTADPSDDEDQDDTLLGFGYPDPAEDGSDTTEEGTTEDYPYPAEEEDIEIGGDEDLPVEEEPEYIDDQPADDYPGYIDYEPEQEDPEYIDDQPADDYPEYTDDQPAEEEPGYTEDDWAEEGGSDDQGDGDESFGQYVNPQLEENTDNWELLDNGSEESMDLPSDSGSIQVSSDGTGSEAIDVSGNSTISFTVSMEDGSDGSGWIEVCDQEGNVIGQTGQVDAGSSTNASFDVSGTDTVQFRACTDDGAAVYLTISNLEMN